MKTRIILSGILILLLTACEKKSDIPDPVINVFSATPAAIPNGDTVTFVVDAVGDHISFYNGKATVDISGQEMPYEERVRFRIFGSKFTPPADTIWAKLAVTNVYDTDNIKSKVDSIEVIILEK